MHKYVYTWFIIRVGRYHIHLKPASILFCLTTPSETTGKELRSRRLLVYHDVGEPALIGTAVC